MNCILIRKVYVENVETQNIFFYQHLESKQLNDIEIKLTVEKKPKKTS